jgi:hypothetical protein
MCALAMAGATVRLAWILTEIDALAAPEAMPYLGFRCPVHRRPRAAGAAVAPQSDRLSLEVPSRLGSGPGWIVALEHVEQLDQRHASLDCIRMHTTQEGTASNIQRVHDGDTHCAARVP